MSGSEFVPLPFDVPVLTQHLNAQDPLALVVRAHLYVEAALIKQIESAFVDKRALDTARLQFSTKLRLAIALGKVEAADGLALERLNKLRNGFSHNLSAKLCDKDELDVFNSLSSKQRKLVDLMRRPNMSFIGRLRCDLMALIVTTAGGSWTP